MQIDPRNVLSPTSIYRSRAAEGVARGRGKTQAGDRDRDGVQVSERARLLQTAREALSQATPPASRQQRVSRLQTAVQSGQYDVPADQVARRLWRSGAIRW